MLAQPDGTHATFADLPNDSVDPDLRPYHREIITRPGGEASMEVAAWRAEEPARRKGDSDGGEMGCASAGPEKSEAREEIGWDMAMSSRGSAASAVMLALLAGGCVLPRPAATLPAAERAYVAVLSGEMPPPIDRVSRHSWIVTHHSGTKEWRRFEMGGGSSSDPFDDFAAGDVMLHGVIEMSDAALDEKETCLAEAKEAYRKKYPSYFPIPGPNSNTLIAFLLRRCELAVELPATAIGRDYVGWIGAQLTEAGTGVQIGTFAFGLRLGLKEGIEVQLLGLPLGVHFWPPGITLPVNPGRLGFATDGHIERKRDEPTYRPPSAANRALWTIAMLTSVSATRDAERANGLEGMGSVGISGRGLVGSRVGYGIGFELEAGAAVPLGFVGAAHLFPIGVGVTLTPTGYLGFFSGVGTSRVSGAVPAGLELTQELRLELDLGRSVRLAMLGRGVFQVTADTRAREDHLLDETRLGAYLGFGKLQTPSRRSVEASGLFFGVERRELLGAAFYGLVLGTQAEFGISRARSLNDYYE